ncbi:MULTISPECIES: HAD family hydrolase [Candidatus Ichthyocystis]|uniref:HAD family hydrolase n=1 Tax=Candidatus Ichthyocystis TaxID=2929841 RepID=UPI000B890534|nr:MULTISPECIES: HAD-IA family hydrolase [Ichthyocystis]
MSRGWDAIFFDLDGTLVDTTTDLRLALNRLCEERGALPVAQGEFLPYTGQGVNKIIEKFFSLDQRSLEFKAAKTRFLDFYYAASHVNSDFFPGMLDIISAIEKLSIPWGIVTGKWRAPTLSLLDHLKLNCPCLVCGDDVSRPKPSPDPLLRAVSLSGVDSSRCVYVGDALCDYESASLCGMEFVGVSWGYQPDMLFRSKVSHVVSSVVELRDYLFK